jgi:hypothetical protein
MRSSPLRETSLDAYLSRTIPERKQPMDAQEFRFSLSLNRRDIQADLRILNLSIH